MSFLDKLKTKVGEDAKPEEKRVEAKIPSDLAQLDVDIYENSSDITIYAPVPGASIEDLDISVEDEGDVVIIQGKKNLFMLETEDKAQCLRQECHWGGFFRQIILPQEININEVDAQLHRGILVLKLPLLRLSGKGKKKILVHGDKEGKEKAKK